MSLRNIRFLLYVNFQKSVLEICGLSILSFIRKRRYWWHTKIKWTKAYKM